MLGYDCKSLLLNGRRFHLRSGEVHYFRIPRAYWKDRLIKAKLAGLSAISTYVPWNFHEVAPGGFDFSGERDLPFFLELCGQLGLRVLLRPGPYICAEWTFGGLPDRLAVLGRQLRTSSAQYLREVEVWVDAVSVIIKRYEDDAGGPIILVQLENEYGSFGDDPEYLEWLRDAYRSRGVRASFYTCDGLGLVERGSIAGELAGINLGGGIPRNTCYMRRVRPDQPVICTEYWNGWFDAWGKPSWRTLKSPDPFSVAELVAYTDGFNFYMWNGGTNFANNAGTTVGDVPLYVTTSYDYNAPVGETGELRPWYFSFRRWILLSAALASVLTVASQLQETSPVPGVRVVTRTQGSEGEARVSFVFNDNEKPVAMVMGEESVLVPGGGRRCAVIIENLCLPGNVRIERCTLEPLAIGYDATFVAENRRVLIVLVVPDCGEPYRWASGEAWQQSVSLLFSTSAVSVEVRGVKVNGSREVGSSTDSAPDQAYEATWDKAQRRLTIRRDPELSPVGMAELTCTAGEWTYQIVLLTEKEADRVWIWQDTRSGVEDWPSIRCAFGMSSSEAVTWVQDSLPSSVNSERTGQLIGPGELLEWRDRAEWEIASSEAAGIDDASGVRVKSLSASSALENLGLPGDDTSYVWYKTTFETSTEGLRHTRTALAAPLLADRALVYLDGQLVGKLGLDTRTFVLPMGLSPGKHNLGFLVEAMGRYNFGHHLCPNRLTGPKGLFAPVYLGGWQADLSFNQVAGATTSGAGPHQVFVAEWNVARPLTAAAVWIWGVSASRIRAVFDGVPLGEPPATPYTDGYELYFLSGVAPGKHVLTVTVYPTPWDSRLVTEDQIRGVIIALPQGGEIKSDWLICPERLPSRWEILGLKSSHVRGAAPAYFRTRFYSDGRDLWLRPFHLSNGLIWVNGRWLGRYREAGPQMEYFIPGAWLHTDSANELILFDEEGRCPTGIQLVEVASLRDVLECGRVVG